jgi:hypothetical protein
MAGILKVHRIWEDWVGIPLRMLARRTARPSAGDVDAVIVGALVIAISDLLRPAVPSCASTRPALSQN